ncbi:MAG: proteasome ATPase [Candidatus Poribacteria bacterium]|jgi:proteasome-associated ATPase|nr:proteasome ATPase [Candidatus Poribacteria bacterium]MDP6961831.1 proteasome ATPase [Dehalococcoidia bacterium]
MPKPDNFSDGMENLRTSSSDGTCTNEDLVRQQMYKIESLQNEIEDLKEQLNTPPTDEADLRLYEMTRELMTAHRRNRKLANALQETREHLQGLKEKVEQLSAPPNHYGIFLNENDDGTIDIDMFGKKQRVNADPDIQVGRLQRGQEVMLNGAFNVVGSRDFDCRGEVVKVKETLDQRRVLISLRADEERVVEVSEQVKVSDLKFGDAVLLNRVSGILMEKLPKYEIEDLMLEEVPDISFNEIGGQDEQIENIRDAIETPYLYPEEYKEFNLSPPKGILLYGPPGCGKTMMASAIANNLAKRIREKTGREDVKGYFINVKGPELLNKYVGETERKIREVFQKARDKSKEGVPVVIFFDEMDSLFRSRGMGISSDMESTVVPTFLAEIDGIEGLRDVIVIGASNRQDLLDPAVLRPGRLDIKIKVARPETEEEARDIFSKYLRPDLPIAPETVAEHDNNSQQAIDHLIKTAVGEMYTTTDDNKFIEVTYARGEREMLYFKDFISGAMIRNIVDRAKKSAIKRLIDKGDEGKGLHLEDIKSAIQEEYKENEDLPNTTNPDDWAKISGRKGERIVNIRAMTNEPEHKKKEVKAVKGGAYL